MLAVLLALVLRSETPPAPTLTPTPPATASPPARFRTLDVSAARDTAPPAPGAAKTTLAVSPFG